MKFINEKNRNTYIGLGIFVMLLLIGGSMLKEHLHTRALITDRHITILQQADDQYSEVDDADERLEDYRYVENSCKEALNDNVKKRTIKSACKKALTMRQEEIKKDYQDELDETKAPSIATAADIAKNADNYIKKIEADQNLLKRAKVEKIYSDKEVKEFEKKVNENIHDLTLLTAASVIEGYSRDCETVEDWYSKDFNLDHCVNPTQYKETDPYMATSSTYDLSLLSSDEKKLIEGDVSDEIEKILKKDHDRAVKNGDSYRYSYNYGEDDEEYYGEEEYYDESDNFPDGDEDYDE